MKTILLIIILFLGYSTFGQFKIDPKVQNEFNKLFKKQPKKIQDIRYLKGVDDGIALVLSIKEDTLNKQDFNPIILDTSIRIFSIDENGNEMPDEPEDNISYNQWLTCKSNYIKDTLYIDSFFGLFSGLGFSVKIINDKTIGGFFEYEHRDSVYRYNLTDIKSSEIRVKARTEKIVLSKVPKKLGDIFYGKATLVTEPFYCDDNEFKKGYIQKKYIITYCFTSKLTDGKIK